MENADSYAKMCAQLNKPITWHPQIQVQQYLLNGSLHLLESGKKANSYKIAEVPYDSK